MLPFFGAKGFWITSMLVLSTLSNMTSGRVCEGCDQNCKDYQQVKQVECDDDPGELRGCIAISRAEDYDTIQTRFCVTDELVKIIGGEFGKCKIVKSENVIKFKESLEPVKIKQNITVRLLEESEGRLAAPTLSKFKVCACRESNCERNPDYLPVESYDVDGNGAFLFSSNVYFLESSVAAAIFLAHRI